MQHRQTFGSFFFVMYWNASVLNIRNIQVSRPATNDKSGVSQLYFRFWLNKARMSHSCVREAFKMEKSVKFFALWVLTGVWRHIDVIWLSDWPIEWPWHASCRTAIAINFPDWGLLSQCGQERRLCDHSRQVIISIVTFLICYSEGSNYGLGSCIANQPGPTPRATTHVSR